MTRTTDVLVVLAALAVAAPGAAQPRWIETKGPHVTVVTDAGVGRGRDIAWQFEQVREAVVVTFPWIRANLSRPLVAVAARDVNTMRALAPALFEKPDGHLWTSMSAGGRDRAYVALRADVRLDSDEGTNPYQSAYFAFAAQALSETASGLPLWLRRGVAEVISNTLVRDNEIQLGRMLTGHLRHLRSSGRMALRDVVAMPDDDPRLKRPEFLGSFDANAWAFVHFLVFGDNGIHRQPFNAYINSLLNGAGGANLLTSTIGDVSKLESPFHIYISRDLFGFAKVNVSAKLVRERLPVRDLPPAEGLALRAAMHVAMDRFTEAQALIAESRTIDPAGGADEADALLADAANRDDDVRALLQKAVTQPRASWYAPYRLATLTEFTDGTMPDIERWLQQATALNPNADDAWSYLASVMANLERGDASLKPIERAIALAPAESRHRVSLARVLRRLNRPDQAMKAAGLARALARTESEKASAQGLLAELAKARLAAANEPETAKRERTTEAPAPVVDGVGNLNPDATPADAAGASVDLDTLPAKGANAADGRTGLLVASCISDTTTCRQALPTIAGACNDGSAPTSGAACRNAGYILDVGLGVPPSPVGAVDYYRKGCARKDDLSCVRLATMQAQGRGVTKDVAAALHVLDTACTGGVQEACFRLGVHLSSTKSPADLSRARNVLTASCKAEFTESCEWLKKLPPG